MRSIFRKFLMVYLGCLVLAWVSPFLVNADPVTSKTLIKQAATLFLLYLSGSIPFGLLIAKFITKKDIRTLGSGNIGTTNVLRTGSKLAAVLTLLCDMLKGLLPLLALTHWGIDIFPKHLFYATFLMPVLGHMYPCWLDFKGGKGIATGLGVIFAFSWPLALISLTLWIAMTKLFKLSSLSGLVAFGVAPFIGLFFAPWPHLIWLGLLSVLVFFAHRDNIKRLLTGQETKFGDTTS